MMRYDPRKAIACLPEGSYQATIAKAEETTSKANKPMVILHFTVYGGDRGEFTLKEYIVAETLWKLKRCAQAISAESSFEKGEFFPADYEGRNLLLELSVEEDADFGDKNRIKAFKKLDRPQAAHAKATAQQIANGEEDDQIPF